MKTMTLILAGDIGGTNTRLQLVEFLAGDFKPVSEKVYASQEYPDLVPLVKQFLQESSQELAEMKTPEKACFAIAGPVVNNTSVLTNLGWSLGAQRLQEALHIKNVALINDFAAVGYGVLGLKQSELYTLQAREPNPQAPIAIIGAGTGLGEGFLIPQGGSYEIFASEGGHADFAPRNLLEFQLLQYLQDKYKISRVSVERVVSGQGIVALYQFLRDYQQEKESPEIAKIVRQWEREAESNEKSVDAAAVIASAAIEKRDSLCEKVMQMFVEAYGAEAGNLALKLLPYGGLYIAGGIAAKNLSAITSGGFMRAFLHKGRVSHLLERVPVYVVLNQNVGLLGAAICASRL